MRGSERYPHSVIPQIRSMCRSYGKPGNGNETETGNGNWKWNWKQKWEQENTLITGESAKRQNRENGHTYTHRHTCNYSSHTCTPWVSQNITPIPALLRQAVTTETRIKYHFYPSSTPIILSGVRRPKQTAV